MVIISPTLPFKNVTLGANAIEKSVFAIYVFVSDVVYPLSKGMLVSRKKLLNLSFQRSYSLGVVQARFAQRCDKSFYSGDFFAICSLKLCNRRLVIFFNLCYCIGVGLVKRFKSFYFCLVRCVKRGKSICICFIAFLKLCNRRLVIFFNLCYCIGVGFILSVKHSLLCFILCG